MHKSCLKHGTHHKAHKQCIKHNPKSLQKQHGYKPHYILKNIINILNIPKLQKASMSYKFKNKHYP